MAGWLIHRGVCVCFGRETVGRSSAVKFHSGMDPVRTPRMHGFSRSRCRWSHTPAVKLCTQIDPGINHMCQQFWVLIDVKTNEISKFGLFWLWHYGCGMGAKQWVFQLKFCERSIKTNQTLATASKPTTWQNVSVWVNLDSTCTCFLWGEERSLFLQRTLSVEHTDFPHCFAGRSQVHFCAAVIGAKFSSRTLHRTSRSSFSHRFLFKTV